MKMTPPRFLSRLLWIWEWLARWRWRRQPDSFDNVMFLKLEENDLVRLPTLEEWRDYGKYLLSGRGKLSHYPAIVCLFTRLEPSSESSLESGSYYVLSIPSYPHNESVRVGWVMKQRTVEVRWSEILPCTLYSEYPAHSLCEIDSVHLHKLGAQMK